MTNYTVKSTSGCDVWCYDENIKTEKTIITLSYGDTIPNKKIEVIGEIEGYNPFENNQKKTIFVKVIVEHQGNKYPGVILLVFLDKS
ncbi:MAG: hypothetical protein HQK50_13610 [Oligoflexia bacterium]|nr:hypothetical protein [Oligoflexia bacterium]